MKDRAYEATRWETLQRMSAKELASHILWWQAHFGLLVTLVSLPLGLLTWIGSDVPLRSAASGCVLAGLLAGLGCAYRYSRLPKSEVAKALRDGFWSS